MAAKLSEGSGIVEHMFDKGVRGLSDAALVEAIAAAVAEESAAAARRLAAIAELTARRCGDDEHAH